MYLFHSPLEALERTVLERKDLLDDGLLKEGSATSPCPCPQTAPSARCNAVLQLQRPLERSNHLGWSGASLGRHGAAWDSLRGRF